MARRTLTGSAVISGGASGLGAATAEALIAEGMAVLLADVNEEVGKATAEDMLTLRPHLRGCSSCRAMVRDYREAPRELAAVLGPAAFVGVGGAGAGSLTDPIQSFVGWVGERATSAMGGGREFLEAYARWAANTLRSPATTSRGSKDVRMRLRCSTETSGA